MVVHVCLGNFANRKLCIRRNKDLFPWKLAIFIAFHYWIAVSIVAHVPRWNICDFIFIWN